MAGKAVNQFTKLRLIKDLIELETATASCRKAQTATRIKLEAAALISQTLTVENVESGELINLCNLTKQKIAHNF